MENMLFIILVHINFALISFILFTDEKKELEILFHLGILLLNLLFKENMLLFLILLYCLNGTYIYRKTKNFFVIVLLNSYCVNIIGIAIFLTIEIPRFFENFNMLINSVFEVLLLLLILWGLKAVDQKFRISTYVFSYKKNRVLSTLLLSGVFLFILWYHEQFSITSLDYLLTSVILILINSFYGLLMILILMYEKREERYLIYMESIKKNEEYYQKLEEFRHDYKNYIDVLEGILQKNESNKELKSVIAHEKNFFETQLNDALHMKLQKIYDPLLQGIFVKFVKRAEGLNIPYNIQVNNVITKLPLNSYDMIRLFTNVFENSLIHYNHEVAEHSPTKEIIIKVDSSGDFLNFEFSNPSTAVSRNLSSLIQKGTTTRENSKGIGLHNVWKIVEDNKNLSLSLKYNKEDQRFYCTLSIIRK